MPGDSSAGAIPKPAVGGARRNVTPAAGASDLKGKKKDISKPRIISAMEEENKELNRKCESLAKSFLELKTAFALKNEEALRLENKYAFLSEKDKDEGPGSKGTSRPAVSDEGAAAGGPVNEVPTGRRESPPPVYIYDNNSHAIKRVLNFNLSTHDYQLLKTQSSINVKFVTMESYKKGVQVLKDRNIKHFTFTPKSEKLIKFVLKGLDGYEPKEVVDELNAIGDLERKAIRAVPMRGKAADFLLVTFPVGTKLADLKGVRSLFNMRVRFEKLRTQGIIQCYNCQRYGHATANCALDSRCVKCGENHRASECTITEKTGNRDKLKCCLCGGSGHPASYKECSKYKELKEAIDKRRERVKNNIRFRNDNVNLKQPIVDMESFPPLPEKSGRHMPNNNVNIPTDSGAGISNFNRDLAEIKNLLLQVVVEQKTINDNMYAMAYCFGNKLSMSQEDIASIFK